MKKTVIAIVILTVAIIIAALIFRPEEKLPAPIQIDTHDQPTMGKADAKVHIIAFEDLKCFACKQFSNTILPKIKQHYIDTGVAKFTMINLAFVPGSMPAANAARCLHKQNPDFFFPFVEYIYQHQPPENIDWATIPKLVEYASHIPGADQDKLSECIYKSPYTGLIENNFKLAQKVSTGDVIVTPTIFINGIRVKPVTYKQVEKIIKHVE